MRKQQTLLAGFAALALFAASGIALAQQSQQGQTGASDAAQCSAQSQGGQQGANTQGRNQSANQGMRNQSARQGRNQNAMSRQSSGQNAQNQSRMQSRQGNAGRSFNRSAQQQNRNQGASATNRTAQHGQNQRNAQSQNQRNAESRATQSRNGQFANQQRNRAQRGTSTAQRNEQLRGLQGSTRAPMQGANEQRNGGGANVSLNDQQRTQIRDTVINSRSAPRVNNPNFSVNVGTVVPRGQIRLVRVPQPLIRIHPGWRRFVFFVYNDQIVIVDPRTMRIVNVLPV